MVDKNNRKRTLDAIKREPLINPVTGKVVKIVKFKVPWSFCSDTITGTKKRVKDIVGLKKLY